MGKKEAMSRASAKITKKQQAVTSCSTSSLMKKALRPRVYITDVDNFKLLVQELTGNCNIPSTQPVPDNVHLPCPPQLPHDIAYTTTVIGNGNMVSSVEDTLIWDDFKGVLQREGTPSKNFPGPESSWHPQLIQMNEQQVDDDALLTLGDIEGWLLDVDSPPSWETDVTLDATSLCELIAGGIYESWSG
ncbi:hypothetical protein MLD38_027262 [Melastoma candidum]|uniref:Uncharacterized protein n=1 Tax=Melastoma candidum TaxID=119954 RepID=A0ACB9P4H2_9MYRT|nr:hypothetical protein MLD38_027262 [Melastoma candidum]